MASRDIVAIGASAGGVEALRFLAAQFQADLPACVLVTLHLPSHYRSALDTILAEAGPLTSSFAEANAPLRKGHIYLAPPGRHLLVENERIVLGDGPRENNARPAIDPMLRSLAVCCGGRSVGVILTGTMSDGASGLWALREAGGFTIVQDPKDALFSEMPEKALKLAQPNYISALSEVPRLVEKLVHSTAQPNLPLPDRIRFDVEIAKNGWHGMAKMDKVGIRSTLTCPDCGGIMWEMEEGDLVRFRCHVGHAYTAETLNIAGDEAVRRGLSAAQRGLEEKVALMKRMEARAIERNQRNAAKTWQDRAEEYAQQAQTIADAVRRLAELVRFAE